MVKYRAEIPEHFVRTDNIRWLEIAPQLHNNIVCGFYMFLYSDINEPCLYDNWYQTLEVAFEVGEDYGVAKEAWELIPG